MKKILTLCACVIWFCEFGMAQDKSLDSLKQAFNSSQNTIDRLKIGLQLVLKTRRDITECTFYQKRSWELIQNNKFDPVMLKLWYDNKAEYHIYRSEFDSSFKFISLYNQLPVTEAEWEVDANILHISSFLNIIIEDYPKSLEYGKKMLQIVRKHKDKKLLSNAYSDIGKAYSFNDTTLYLSAVYLDSAFQIDKKLLGKVDPIIVTKLAHILAKIGYPDSSNKLLLPYIKIEAAKKLANRQLISSMYEVVLLNSVEIADTNLAIQCIDSINSLASNESTLHRMLNAHSISNSLENLGLYQKALSSFKNYLILNDSVHEEEKNKELLKLNTEYETALKEKKIAEQQLSLKNAAIANIELKKNLQLAALKIEYEAKQNEAKSSKEKQKIQFEEEIKRREIIAQAEMAKNLVVKTSILKDKEISDQKLKLGKRRNVILGITGLAAFFLMTGILMFFLYKTNKKNNILLASKNQKIETLILELQHRTKNNMQVISSLLSLQSDTVHNDDARNILEKGKNRIDAMALIHQKLYTNDGIATIDFKEYAELLVSQLIKSYSIEGSAAPKLIKDIDLIDLNIDIAVPLGLIINELVTNSLKYGLVNPSPELSIRIKNNLNNKILVNVKDNGPGFNQDIQTKATLGLKLIKALTKQIKGTIEFINKNGMEVVIHVTKTSK